MILKDNRTEVIIVQGRSSSKRSTRSRKQITRVNNLRQEMSAILYTKNNTTIDFEIWGTFSGLQEFP